MKRLSRPTWLSAGTADPDRGHFVTAAAALIVTNLGFRGWALYSSWFVSDDYVLLHDAQTRLSRSYLLNPFDSHLMPGGRLVVWLVAESGPLNWPMAATLVLVMQALAALAAFWMLVTLFGARWGTLPLLALYLWSVMTVPAMLWLAAAVILVPLQIAFFGAVTAWVRYLRDRRRSWLAATTAFVLLGLLCTEKALLVLGVLAFLTLGYFAIGGPWHRTSTAIRRYWPGFLIGLAVAGAYAVYYATQVPQPFLRTKPAVFGDLAQTMVGTAFGSAAVGGPWRWDTVFANTSYADPPVWAQSASWVVLVAAVATGFLTRTRTLRAWALMLGYLVAIWLLVAKSRAAVAGGVIGLDYRYLADAVCALTLCLGLAFLPLQRAPESSAPRAEPLLNWRTPPLFTALATALVCGMALISSVKYIDSWITTNDSDTYVHNLAQSLHEAGDVDLADTTVPPSVMSPLDAPHNRLSVIAGLLTPKAHFPDTSPDLMVVDATGALQRAGIEQGLASRKGPKAGCGWPVDANGVSVPLKSEAFDWVWWLRIGYLAEADSPVTISAGRSRLNTSLQAGANSLFVRLEGTFSNVAITGVTRGDHVCVDTIEVGQPEPGGPS